MSANQVIHPVSVLFLSATVALGQTVSPAESDREAKFFETVPDVLLEKLMERIGDPDTYNKSRVSGCN